MPKNLEFSGEISIRDFMTAVGSAEGVHGTVSSAAVAAGLGSSLLLMVATLPWTRSDSPTDPTKLIEMAAALTDIREQLIETVETDTAVKLFAARNLPQASERQRAERQAAIQLALRAAADIPLEVMRLSARALKLGEVVAAQSPRAAAPDIALGVALLHSAFGGARSSLEAKLTTLTYTDYITSVVDEIARLSEDETAAVRASEALLQLPPA